MKSITIARCLLSVLPLVAVQNLPAQGLPTEQPKFLTIVREKVKVGKSADHSKHEAGWPAAFEKAKFPDYYLAMTSLTGSPEAWYITPSKSHAAEAESMKRQDKDPVLSAELSRLSARDAEFIEGASVIRAVAMPDLSLGKFPDIGKARFFLIGTYEVRQGKTEQFESIIKAYNAAWSRTVSSNLSVRVYSVMAGMPTPTYIAIMSVEDYAQFDKIMEESSATHKAATDEEKDLFTKKSGECVSKEEYNYFRVDPVQSYVPKEVREKDPEFWLPK